MLYGLTTIDTRMGAFVVAASLSGVATAGAPLIQTATDPSTWAADNIASLNIDDTGYSFPDGAGFSWGFGGTEIDATDITSDVYRMNASMDLGSLVLNPGDLVFAYRIRLVQGVAGSTVSSLDEIQILGAPAFGFGDDVMLRSVLNGQGFVSTSAGTPDSGNFDGEDSFGASADWEWPGDDASNLDNDEFITLLMFTDPAQVGLGVANLFAPPGQTNGLTGVVQAGEAPPVLIPTIPAPGVGGLLALGSVGLLRRRRGG